MRGIGSFSIQGLAGARRRGFRGRSSPARDGTFYAASSKIKPSVFRAPDLMRLTARRKPLGCGRPRCRLCCCFAEDEVMIFAVRAAGA
jgi:hypothetical protein